MLPSRYHRSGRSDRSRECRVVVTNQTNRAVQMMSVVRGILLQKSKVASVRMFGETLKREAIDNSDNLSRVTEVAYEFSVRR